MTESPFSPVHGDRGEPATRPIAPAGVTIAISREAGARGGSIARRVGKRLGWQVYNQELLEYLCATESAREPLLAEVPASATSWIDAQLDRVARDHGIDPRIEGGVMPRLILSLAARGDVILLGRGAGYYLPRESSLHVRVVAPLADRIAHMADWSRLTHAGATLFVQQLDKRRAEFLLTHFGRRTTDPYDFDLSLNSGLLREETCADAIIAALNGKQDQLEGDSRLG